MTSNKKNSKNSFKEATKGMNADEINRYRQELSEQSFDDVKSKRDDRGGLINDLHNELFPEAYDYGYDSSSEAKARSKGINPMQQEYTDKVNTKRVTLGISPLGNDGMETDSSSMQYCTTLANKLTDKHLSELIKKISGVESDKIFSILDGYQQYNEVN